jgi:hypothetical protein
MLYTEVHVMRKSIVAAGMVLLAALALPGALRADPLQSGPQVGEKVPGPFAPLNITGPNAGEKCCQYCKNGSRPAVAVFAREITPAVIQLLKTIDNTTAMNREQGLGSYVVFCNDADGLGRRLQEIARKEKFQHIVLTLYRPGGPEKYRLSPAADVTVLVYHHLTVKANHAFKNGDLSETAIGAVGAGIAKMMAEK